MRKVARDKKTKIPKKYLGTPKRSKIPYKTFCGT